MALELAEIAAGLPLAASFAVAGGITTTRERRRRVALNEAMHELRRPLQVLSLALPENDLAREAAGSALRLAVAALDRLDREVNGRIAAEEPARVPVGPLLEEAVRRWQPQARKARVTLALQLGGGEEATEGSPADLAQAVDNLIDNAIRHGGRAVTVAARRGGGQLEILVRDEGPRSAGLSAPTPEGRCRVRHGHGLRVARRVARSHGGSFAFRRLGQGAEARLRLPLAAPGRDR